MVITGCIWLYASCEAILWVYDSWASSFGAFFDAHVLEFAGLENLAALQALDEFGVFVAAHNLHARVFARFLVGFGGWENGFEVINPEASPSSNARGTDSREFPVF